VVLIIIISFFLQDSAAQKRFDSQNQDKELGKVNWYRDYNTALELSKKEDKPILILFQEIPDCETCRNYRHNVLSQQLMTEAIDNEFIPLAIFNNKKGKNLDLLKKHKEPTWNNPTVRIVNTNGENIVNRFASNYSSIALYNAMINASESSGNSNTKYFKMYCFWKGEKNWVRRMVCILPRQVSWKI
jgi:hypothetical protein|tara:strand:+ start:994 stop:1554 length:561 start_codon:yes stop_codon:yes gene_type:complete